MSGMRVAVATFSKAAKLAAGSDVVYWQGDGKVSTAKIGFFQRIVQYFSGADQKPAEHLLASLKAEHGPEAGLSIFKMARGQRAQEDGVAADVKTPLTARHIRDADDYVNMLEARKRHEALEQSAMGCSPRLPDRFAKIARKAVVDPADLRESHNELYTRLLQDHVVLAPDAVATQKDIKELAVKTLKYVALLSEGQAQRALEMRKERHEQAVKFLHDLGVPVAHTPIHDVAARDLGYVRAPSMAPDEIAASLRRFHEATTWGISDPGLSRTIANADAHKNSQMMLSRAMADLDAGEARRLYRIVIAEGGAGNSLLFAATVNAAQLVGKAAGAAAEGLRKSIFDTLRALGERAGLDMNDVKWDLQDIQDLGVAAGKLLAKRGDRGEASSSRPPAPGSASSHDVDRLIAARRRAVGLIDSLGRQSEDVNRIMRARYARSEALASSALPALRLNLKAARLCVLAEEELVSTLRRAGVPDQLLADRTGLNEVRAILMTEIRRETERIERPRPEGSPPFEELSPFGVRLMVECAAKARIKAIEAALEGPNAVRAAMAPVMAALQGGNVSDLSDALDHLNRQLDAAVQRRTDTIGADFDAEGWPDRAVADAELKSLAGVFDELQTATNMASPAEAPQIRRQLASVRQWNLDLEIQRSRLRDKAEAARPDLPGAPDSLHADLRARYLYEATRKLPADLVRILLSRIEKAETAAEDVRSPGSSSRPSPAQMTQRELRVALTRTLGVSAGKGVIYDQDGTISHALSQPDSRGDVQGRGVSAAFWLDIDRSEFYWQAGEEAVPLMPRSKVPALLENVSEEDRRQWIEDMQAELPGRKLEAVQGLYQHLGNDAEMAQAMSAVVHQGIFSEIVSQVFWRSNAPVRLTDGMAGMPRARSVRAADGRSNRPDVTLRVTLSKDADYPDAVHVNVLYRVRPDFLLNTTVQRPLDPENSYVNVAIDFRISKQGQADLLGPLQYDFKLTEAPADPAAGRAPDGLHSTAR